jgi:hypothetical protein
MQCTRTYFGSSKLASSPGLRFLRSENTPSSHFLVALTGRPNASNRKDRARTVVRYALSRDESRKNRVTREADETRLRDAREGGGGGGEASTPDQPLTNVGSRDVIQSVP